MAVEKEDSATEAIGAVASTILVVLHVGAISVCMESMLLLLYDIFTHSVRPGIVNKATCQRPERGKTC